MKLRPRPSLTQPQIFDGGYEHPWYKQTLELYGDNNLELYNLDEILTEDLLINIKKGLYELKKWLSG